MFAYVVVNVVVAVAVIAQLSQLLLAIIVHAVDSHRYQKLGEAGNVAALGAEKVYLMAIFLGADRGILLGSRLGKTGW